MLAEGKVICFRFFVGSNLSSYCADHLFTKKLLLCSVSVNKYPGNKMLGWRKFVDGKVNI